jgi:dTDP-4-dehydrorhamnose 3,5-epimerase
VIFTPGGVSGSYVIDLEPRADERGYFGRTWCEQEFAAHDLETRIAQINVAVNTKRGTLRGLHYQLAPSAEVKLVRCTRGAVFDVMVDLRPSSSTYREWFGVELNETNARALYIPTGCAHGYLTLEPASDVQYLTSCAFAPSAARGVRFDDPAFGIEWPAAPEEISAADRSWPYFVETSQ